MTDETFEMRGGDMRMFEGRGCWKVGWGGGIGGER